MGFLKKTYVWIISATPVAILSFCLGYYQGRETFILLGNSTKVAERRPSIEVNKGAPVAAHPIEQKVESEATDWAAEVRKRNAAPSVQASLLRDASRQVAEKYGRLFQQLRSLTPEGRAGLRSILARKLAAQEREGVPASDHEAAEDATERFAAMQAIGDDSDAEINSAIGADNFAIYQNYEQSYAYRGTIEAVTNILRSDGLLIDDNLEERILDTYGKVVGETSSAGKLDNSMPVGVSLSADQQALARSKQRDRFDQQLSDAMSKIMDQRTYNAFMSSELANELNN